MSLWLSIDALREFGISRSRAASNFKVPILVLQSLSQSFTVSTSSKLLKNSFIFVCNLQMHSYRNRMTPWIDVLPSRSPHHSIFLIMKLNRGSDEDPRILALLWLPCPHESLPRSYKSADQQFCTHGMISVAWILQSIDTRTICQPKVSTCLK